MSAHDADPKVNGVERFSEMPIHTLSPHYVVVTHDHHGTSISVNSMGFKRILIGPLPRPLRVQRKTLVSDRQTGDGYALSARERLSRSRVPVDSL